jgi:hypothetical protein
MVTLKADDRSRVKLPGVQPGQVFALENEENGIVKLTPVKEVESAEDRPAKVHFEKRAGYTVGVTDRPIDMEALKQALKELP